MQHQDIPHKVKSFLPVSYVTSNIRMYIIILVFDLAILHVMVII